MIKIGILGDIGSGKSYVAKNFGYPVFNADTEVGKLYKKDRKIFNKLKKALPKHIHSFPIIGEYLGSQFFYLYFFLKTYSFFFLFLNEQL